MFCPYMQDKYTKCSIVISKFKITNMKCMLLRCFMSRSRIFRLHGDDTFYRFLSKIILSILSCRHDIHQLNIYVNMQLINVNILMVTTCTLKMNFIHCLFIISFRPVREYLTHIRTSQFPMKGCNSTALEEGVSLQCYIFYHLKTRNLTLSFDKY